MRKEMRLARRPLAGTRRLPDRHARLEQVSSRRRPGEAAFPAMSSAAPHLVVPMTFSKVQRPSPSVLVDEHSFLFVFSGEKIISA